MPGPPALALVLETVRRKYLLGSIGGGAALKPGCGSDLRRHGTAVW